jgi:hypothetical protein
MATAHVWKQTITVPGLSALPADPSITISGNYSQEVDQVVAPGTTVEVDVGTIVAAKIVSMVLNSDQVNVTINTNASNGSGGDTISLGAAKTLSWNNTLTFAVPINHDITKFFITNGAAKATNFRAGFLMNV